VGGKEGKEEEASGRGEGREVRKHPHHRPLFTSPRALARCRHRIAAGRPKFQDYDAFPSPFRVTQRSRVKTSTARSTASLLTRLPGIWVAIR